MATKHSRTMALARISRALVGYQIPMLSIPALNKALEQAISAGRSDDELRTLVGSFPGVTVCGIG